jgi:hypothetical protein
MPVAKRGTAPGIKLGPPTLWEVGRWGRKWAGSAPKPAEGSRYNSLDAQASMPDDSDSFNALWRKRFIDAVGR